MKKKLISHLDRILNEAKIDPNAFDDYAGIVIEDQSFLIVALELFFDMSYVDLAHKWNARLRDDKLVIPLETTHPDYDWFDVDVLLGNGDGTTKQRFLEWLRKEL